MKDSAYDGRVDQYRKDGGHNTKGNDKTANALMTTKPGLLIYAGFLLPRYGKTDE